MRRPLSRVVVTQEMTQELLIEATQAESRDEIADDNPEAWDVLYGELVTGEDEP